MLNLLINQPRSLEPFGNNTLKPFIITADEQFFVALASQPALKPISMLLPALEDVSNMKSLLGNSLILFVDVDAYNLVSLMNFVKQSQVYVIAVSDVSELDKVLCYLKSGLHGYFLKNDINVELIADTAKTFPGKGIPISPFLTQSMIHELIGVQRNDFEAVLSKREHEILQQLADGSSYKMIASNLTISIETVRHHIKNLYKKLDVKSKGEIIAKLLKKP